MACNAGQRLSIPARSVHGESPVQRGADESEHQRQESRRRDDADNRSSHAEAEVGEDADDHGDGVPFGAWAVGGLIVRRHARSPLRGGDAADCVSAPTIAASPTLAVQARTVSPPALLAWYATNRRSSASGTSSATARYPTRCATALPAPSPPPTKKSNPSTCCSPCVTRMPCRPTSASQCWPHEVGQPVT